MTTKPSLAFLIFTVLGGSALPACGDDTTAGVGGGAAVDETCESTDDCKEGLECDVHDGEGTCQEPH